MTVTVYDYGESYEYDEYDLCWYNLGARYGNTGPKRWVVEIVTDPVESPWVHGIMNAGFHDQLDETTFRTVIDTQEQEGPFDETIDAEMVAVTTPEIGERIRYNVILGEDSAVLYEHGVSQ